MKRSMVALLTLSALACAPDDAVFDTLAVAELVMTEAVPPPSTFMLSPDGGYEGGTMTVVASGADPGATLRFFGSPTLGAGPCAGPVCLDISPAYSLGVLTADLSGSATLVVNTPGSVVAGDVVVFQAVVVAGARSYKSPVTRMLIELGSCPTVDPNDRYFDRFEGTGLNNRCRVDSDCMVGGCSAEVCAAEAAFTTCELLPYGPEGSCGCVQGTCIWNDVCP